VAPASSPATATKHDSNGTPGRDGKGEQRGVPGKLGELSADGYGAQPTDKTQFDQAAGHACETRG
jgi:hypothetical protein